MSKMNELNCFAHSLDGATAQLVFWVLQPSTRSILIIFDGVIEFCSIRICQFLQLLFYKTLSFQVKSLEKFNTIQTISLRGENILKFCSNKFSL